MKSRLQARTILQRIGASLAATTLVFGAPATLAFAHDPGEYQGFFNHFYDHLEHQQFHQQFNDEHNAAHWGGLPILSNTKPGTAPTEPHTSNSMRTIQPHGMTITVTATTGIART
jgi:hypothetical protein